MNKINEATTLENTQKIEINSGDNDQVERPKHGSEITSHPSGEFKITVRKLEMPVRPRGVLAE